MGGDAGGYRPATRRLARQPPARWLLVMVAACGFSVRARAHDAPQVRAILFRPGGRVLLQTNRGLLFADSAEGPWRLMCNEALDVSTSELPPIAYDSRGRLLAATSAGLHWSADDGCNWQREQVFGDLLVPALAVHPDQPETIYVTTFPVGEASPEVSGGSAIRVSHDGGDSYQDLRVVADDDYIHSLRIAPSAPDRLYAAGAVYDMGRLFYVLRSSDAGTSWQRFEVDIADDETDLLLLAVDPTDPDVLLAKAVAGEPSLMSDRLLVSRDGGETFTSTANVSSLRDASFSDDGSTVWLAGRDGLFRSNGALTSFERVGVSAQMTCVIEHDGALYGCGRFAGDDADPTANGVGVSHDGGESFSTWMSFEQVVSPIACDEGATTTPACAPWWNDWQREQETLFGVSASTADAGARAGAPDIEPREDAPAAAVDAGAASGPRELARDDEPVASGCSVAPRSRGTRRSAWPWLGACALTCRVAPRARRRKRARLGVRHGKGALTAARRVAVPLGRGATQRWNALGAWLLVLLGCTSSETDPASGASAAGSPAFAMSAAGAAPPGAGSPAPVVVVSGGTGAIGGAGAAMAQRDADATPLDAGAAMDLPTPTGRDAGGRDPHPQDASYPVLGLGSVAAPVRLATGFALAESPLWDPCEHRLLFTDVRGDGDGIIHTATADGEIGVLATGTGNANGIAFDLDGSLVLAQMGGSPGHLARLTGDAITILDPPSSPTLHTPDDVIVRSEGAIYFSDGDFYPIGTLLGYARRLPVYMLAPGAAALVEVARVSGPNGLEFSPDERTLYVSAYGAGEIVPFDVADDGTLTERPALIRGLDNSDSLCVDAAGNLYVGVNAGLHVARPDGEPVGLIPIPGATSTTGTTNCGFGGEDGTTLFITSWTSLYKVEGMPIPGQDFLVNRARLRCE